MLHCMYLLMIRPANKSIIKRIFKVCRTKSFHLNTFFPLHGSKPRIIYRRVPEADKEETSLENRIAKEYPNV
jgi:hypothetical protein